MNHYKKTKIHFFLYKYKIKKTAKPKPCC